MGVFLVVLLALGAHAADSGGWKDALQGVEASPAVSGQQASPQAGPRRGDGGRIQQDTESAGSEADPNKALLDPNAKKDETAPKDPNQTGGMWKGSREVPKADEEAKAAPQIAPTQIASAFETVVTNFILNNTDEDGYWVRREKKLKTERRYKLQSLDKFSVEVVTAGKLYRGPALMQEPGKDKPVEVLFTVSLHGDDWEVVKTELREDKPRAQRAARGRPGKAKGPARGAKPPR